VRADLLYFARVSRGAGLYKWGGNPRQEVASCIRKRRFAPRGIRKLAYPGRCHDLARALASNGDGVEEGDEA